MAIRQPIVSVLGHVDHGKTLLLDAIRGTRIVEKEPGRITQHIGATEVPINIIYKICGPLLKGKKFKVPGLLFIDTPGHLAFTTLRARGGALADLAILVVDIKEGIMAQTLESLNILKLYKTPFAIVLNKIDLLDGWRAKKLPFVESIKEQSEYAIKELDDKIYELAGKLYEHGFSAERYDRIKDFTRNVAIVPVSAKSSEGIADLLVVLVGLAQKFLEKQLTTEEEKPGEGVVLEVKEEKGLGKTLDAIIYNGRIAQGDTLVLGGRERPIITKVKAILKPKPLEEARVADNFVPVESVTAACGIKLVAPELEEVISGAPLKVARAENIDEVIRAVRSELKTVIETSNEGVTLKADAIGSLEALAFELKAKNIKIRKAEIGDVSKKDIIEASTIPEPLDRVILCFNVKILPEAKEEVAARKCAVLESNVIYQLLESYEKWRDKRGLELEKERREVITYPGKLKILTGCVFRTSKPAIVGVRVLGGRVKVGQELLREDGRVVGKIKSIRSVEESFKEALAGKEIAIAIEGATVGRQINEEDLLYIDISEQDAKKLKELEKELSFEEKEILEKIYEIKRKEKPFWGA
ncbi:MAG: translation initiation factor IF-2 [Candidatus Thermoplasmatota archaeon]|nr:translation initiation factor IF-2 [Candidatus Thermoplasmatota archaeon]